MGERNDLIENPPVVAWIITDRNGFRSVTQSHVSAETMLRLGAEATSLVRLSDFVALRATIASLSEALAEAEKKGAEDWQPIETAPKDGTPLDLWSSEFGRHTDCHWGKPQHCCGEAGRYCDSDWHTEPEGWVDGVLNVILSDPEEFTHWRPLPTPPRDLSQGGQP